MRNRLLIMVIVPLLGAGLLSERQASDEIQRERVAHTVQIAAETLSAVDGLRRDIENEIEPAGRSEVLREGQSKDLRGYSQTDLDTVNAQAAIDIRRTQAATDASFRALRAGNSNHRIAGEITQINVQLQQARLSFANHDGLIASYERWLAILQGVADVETSLMAGLDRDGLGAEVSADLDDLRTVTNAAELAEQVFIRYGLTVLAAVSDIPQTRTDFLTVWGTFQTASAQAARNTAAPVRQAWVAATSTDETALLDGAILNSVPQTQPISLIELDTLGTLASERQVQLNSVVALSAERTMAAAGLARSDAQRRLAVIVGENLLLLLICLSVALAGRSWIARSLDRLAEVASRLSEGDLVDVEVTGPRECRTVARALGATVTTLRRIEEQATAVTEGRLGSDVLHSPMPGPLGQLVHTSISRLVEAVQDREVAQQELAYQAAHDGLTDLPNRAEAVKLIERSLHRAQRTGAMTGLMFLDLDHFKAVNDTFGHGAGDQVLREVAHRMINVVREGDVVSRLGGDEFVILLENLADESAFVPIATRLLETMAEPIFFGERKLKISASIGVTVCRDSHVDGNRLMREADAAVYRAKAAGRSRVDVFDDQLREQLAARVELESDMAAGLTRNEFVLYYQPVVDLVTGCAVGLEALIRWLRPGVGMVSPDEFIPVAESSSLINDIGRFALREATNQLAVWTAQCGASRDLTMAVNLSGRHLASHHVVADVIEMLSCSGIAPERLVVELTETTIVDDPTAMANMQALRDLGVRVAIDDFGTGYTSIGHLPTLPVDVLKIDRSFVSAGQSSHHELVRLMVAAGRAFGMAIIAEGVETEEQAEWLRQLGVEACQGYLYSRPEPASALNPIALMRGQTEPDGKLGQLRTDGVDVATV